MDQDPQRQARCWHLLVVCIACALTACGGASQTTSSTPSSGSNGSSSTTGSSSTGSSSTGSSSTGSSVATDLRISGSPPAAVAVGGTYSFQPTTTAASGTVGYSINNMPSWASFSTVTGRLSGTPSGSNVGVYSNIVISVSDGGSEASLAPFSVTVGSGTTVAADGAGSATLAWSPPASNTDGTPLQDLAGFYIYYGTSSSDLTHLINNETGGLDTGSFTVTGLAPGTYYFQVSAYTALGVQSAPSNEISVTVS